MKMFIEDLWMAMPNVEKCVWFFEYIKVTAKEIAFHEEMFLYFSFEYSKFETKETAFYKGRCFILLFKDTSHRILSLYTCKVYIHICSYTMV